MSSFTWKVETLSEMIGRMNVGYADNVSSKIVDRTIKKYANDAVMFVGEYAFYRSEIISINLPKCELVHAYAFKECPNLMSVDLPKCRSVYYESFKGCSELTSVNTPECETVGRYAFQNCYKLTSIDLPKCKSIDRDCFYRCSSLTSITLRSSTVCTLLNTTAFDSSGITSTSGAIYVPAELVEAYKTATNWSTFADIIQAIPEETT